MSKPRVVVLIGCCVLLCLPACPLLADVVVDTAWVREYNGPGNYEDWPKAMAVDASGNIYVTGRSSVSQIELECATLKYRVDGDTAWLRTYDSTLSGDECAYAIAVDKGGNSYVTGWCAAGCLTIKYQPNGDTAWVRTYPGAVTYAVAVSGENDVYVTGTITNAGSGGDYLTIKYEPDGSEGWVHQYNGPGNSGDVAVAIAVDIFGNVFVTGKSAAIETEADYLTIKYYAAGDTAWTRRYNGPGDDWDVPSAMVVDESGSVYITGYSSQTPYPDRNNDFATIGYDSSGSLLWIARYDGPASDEDEAQAIAVDGYGNVYVTGESQGVGTDIDYATIRYYPGGDTAWVRRYNGSASSTDEVTAMALDSSGNVYVTGYSLETETWLDYLTIRYSPSGDVEWLTRYDGGESKNDGAYAIAVDRFGNVCVAGASYATGSDFDYATVKYCQALRGDVNGDSVIDVGDAVYILNYLFKGGPPPLPVASGDTNCDGIVDIGDAVYLLNYLFKGGPPPDCP
jgi:hypothetical protein